MPLNLEDALVLCKGVEYSDLDSVATFLAAARTGWPQTIRELQAAEKEIDRLHNELNILQEQMNQRGCHL